MRRILFSLYGFAFFNKFLLLTPVYTIYMQQNGISDILLSTLFIISSAATIFGQMPIAYMTNRFGARNAMIFGQCLKIMAILLWLFIPTTFGFVTGIALWGVQSGFRSVSFEGLIYEQVVSHHRKRDYTRILGRKATLESIGVALSATGSLLMFLGYAWVSWASVVAVALSIVCLMMIPRVNTNQTSYSANFLGDLRQGIRAAIKIPCLMPIMLLALFVVNVPYLDDFLSPIGVQLGIATEYVGIVPFFLLLCATIGQRFAYLFGRASDGLIYTSIGIVGVLYILFACTYTPGALWMLGVSYTLTWCAYTLLYSRFQQMIPPRHRSIILSLFTTLTYLVYMVVCGIIGLGSMLGSWRYGIFIIGIVVLMVCAWALLFVRTKRCDLLR